MLLVRDDQEPADTGDGSVQRPRNSSTLTAISRPGAAASSGLPLGRSLANAARRRGAQVEATTCA
ncbi:hypothetical protein AQJ58_24820 [Streptomyces sp. DSM 15324]|nr:hypothetical protein AQJ58_24820 [Streptomyces sp. DSM 15324]